LILAINTTAGPFGLALLEKNGSVRAEIFASQGKGHYGALMPAVGFLISSCGATPSEIEAVAVATGPGSFTGLRIGLSTAKGFSHALNVPVIGIPSLEAMALQCSCTELPLVAFIDSRRGEFFACCFMPGTGGRYVRKSEDLCLRAEDMGDLFKEKSLVIGNNFPGQWPIIREALGEKALSAPIHLWKTDAASLVIPALERLANEQYDDPDFISPLYFRPPDIRAPHPA